MEWYHVYLFTRLDGLRQVAFSCATLLATVTAGCGIAWFIEQGINNTAAAKYRKLFLRGTMATLLASIFTVLVPTQKEAAAIYLLPKLVKSDFAKEAGQIPTDAAKLMRLKLESWIADMEPPKVTK